MLVRGGGDLAALAFHEISRDQTLETNNRRGGVSISKLYDDVYQISFTSLGARRWGSVLWAWCD